MGCPRLLGRCSAHVDGSGWRFVCGARQAHCRPRGGRPSVILARSSDKDAAVVPCELGAIKRGRTGLLLQRRGFSDGPEDRDSVAVLRNTRLSSTGALMRRVVLALIPTHHFQSGGGISLDVAHKRLSRVCTIPALDQTSSTRNPLGYLFFWICSKRALRFCCLRARAVRDPLSRRRWRRNREKTSDTSQRVTTETAYVVIAGFFEGSNEVKKRSASSAVNVLNVIEPSSARRSCNVAGNRMTLKSVRWLHRQ
eukprot:scaffold57294_cov32-Tisochrysis_lutea.AAC.7